MLKADDNKDCKEYNVRDSEDDNVTAAPAAASDDDGDDDNKNDTLILSGSDSEDSHGLLHLENYTWQRGMLAYGFNVHFFLFYQKNYEHFTKKTQYTYTYKIKCKITFNTRIVNSIIQYQLTMRGTWPWRI